MSIKSSINDVAIQHTCIFFIIIIIFIITKIECWPVFKQDPNIILHKNTNKNYLLNIVMHISI